MRVELDVLARARDANLAASARLDDLSRQLKAINEAIWETEDAIREEERDKRFGERFVALARSVYHNNDQRAAIKERGLYPLLARQDILLQFLLRNDVA